MSKILSLQAEARHNTGKGPARSLKVNKRIPAIIYGGGKSHVMISLPEKELTLEYHKSGFMSHLFDIQVEQENYRVIPKQIQLDPVSDRVIHADFIHVGENDKIKVSVLIEFHNKDKCIGIKQSGVLNALKHEIEVLCTSETIPESIIIDLTELQIGQSIHVKDMKFPAGVEPNVDLDQTILTITGSTKESEVAPVSVAAAAATPDKKDAAKAAPKAAPKATAPKAAPKK